jgi:D-hexose-6-phosphate mutarotase
MSAQEIAALNGQFAIPGHLSFAVEQGGLTMVHVRNAHATADILTYGGQVLSFAPHGRAGVLWTSSAAVYAPGKAVRGGIPVCWPWFGPHPSDPAKPAHGFVRNRPWRVLQTAFDPSGATILRLGLTDDAATNTLWPHAFDLQIQLTIGQQLRAELTTRNSGGATFTVTGALHSYFAIGDIAQVRVQGLDGIEYLDQLSGERHRQEGPVAITGETDRIYFGAPGVCVIEDLALRRRIAITSSGSRATVVWNPWVEKARRLADFGDDEYTGMLCVETANAADDQISIPPGGTHTLATEIDVEDR